MNDVLVQLFKVQETMVLSQLDNGAFTALTPAPAWVEPLIGRQDNDTRTISLTGRSHFLDLFIDEAQSHWRKQSSAVLTSGECTETLNDNEEVVFEASAVVIDNHPLLILQNLESAIVRRAAVPQQLRNHMLDNEFLEQEVRRRTQEIRQREEEIVARLLGAAGLRDDETGMHIRRIGLSAEAMAKALGWPQDRIDDIRVAAPMHDIGKIGIPDNVLLKPGKLDPEELAVMKRHAEYGGKMLEGSAIPLLEMSREIALYHHEKWDGSGYPNGLKGDEIPVSARITAIVDVFDALTHRRVYKVAFTEKDALELMRKDVGSHFDPELFDVFTSILPEIRRIGAENPDQTPDWAPDVSEFGKHKLP